MYSLAGFHKLVEMEHDTENKLRILSLLLILPQSTARGHAAFIQNFLCQFFWMTLRTLCNLESATFCKLFFFEAEQNVIKILKSHPKLPQQSNMGPRLTFSTMFQYEPCLRQLLCSKTIFWIDGQEQLIGKSDLKAKDLAH